MRTVQPPDVEDHLTLEQLSALLDGEAGDDARAHRDSCDRCAAALTRMVEAREVLRQEPTLPPQLVDAAIAAGVGALPRSNVAPLAPRWRTNPLPWLAGAAAALVAVLGLASLVNGGVGDRDADTVANGVAESADEFGASSGGSATAGGGSGGATADAESQQDLSAGDGDSVGGAGGGSTGRSAAPPPARAFDSEDALVAYLRESADKMTTTATSCSTEASAALGAPVEALRSEDVSWQDGTATLWVDPNARRAVLMRPGGCSLLADLRY